MWWVPPFRYPRIKGCSHLPTAFRSVPRLSSPLNAKASIRCPFALDLLNDYKNHYFATPKIVHSKLHGCMLCVWLPTTWIVVNLLFSVFSFISCDTNSSVRRKNLLISFSSHSLQMTTSYVLLHIRYESFLISPNLKEKNINQTVNCLTNIKSSSI